MTIEELKHLINRAKRTKDIERIKKEVVEAWTKISDPPKPPPPEKNA